MSFPISAALLDACVLAILNKGDAYGYVLTQSLKVYVDISESTLYPVLRRLQKEDYLTTYDLPYSGRNRRYYAITDRGKEKLDEYSAAWLEYKANLDKLLLGGCDYE